MRKLPVLVAFLFTGLVAAVSAEKPDILLIMVDDMGFSDLGCTGSEIDTPNLDQLAKDGLLFTQFYNTGRCWPTRASLMTGLYPHEAGHASRGGPKAPPAYRGTTREVAPFVSELLKEQGGYRTYHVGKWHLNAGGPLANHSWPLDRGFERSYAIKQQDNFFNPVEILDEGVSVKRPGNDDPDYYVTDAFTERTLAYLDEHAEKHADEPFFLYLAHTAPHFPLHARAGDVARFRGRFKEGWDVIRKRRHDRQIESGVVGGPLSDRDEAAVAWDSLSPEEQDKWDGRMACHAAMIYRVDVGIGTIVEKLKALGRYENTLILFLSDNGASAEYIVRGDGHDPAAPLGSGETYTCLEVGWANAANSPFRQHKIWVHEGGISTPLIAHWPAGIAETGKLTDQSGHVIDIVPTILELAEVDSPEKMTGKSLLPILQGKEREGHDAIYWEHEGNRAVRQGDWKLVGEQSQDWELYNFGEGRSEMANRIEIETEKADELKKLWQIWADKVGVVMPEGPRKYSKDYRMK
jgi:arylsulfatase